MDCKRTIVHGSPASLRWRAMTARGEVPSFREAFGASRVEWLTDDRKTGREMIQFSFFLRASDGRILLFKRSDVSHRLTRGTSIFVSWSPVVERFEGGAPFPATAADILDIFHREISPDVPLAPKLRYAGFAMNDLPGMKRYYFYLFEAACAPTGERLAELAERWGSERFFVKDREEILGAFSAEQLLEQRRVCNAVDRLFLQWLIGGRVEGVLRSSETCFLAPFTGERGQEGIPEFLIR